MALRRNQKTEQIEEVSKLLADSKLTVFANYSGIDVKQIRDLRKQAKENQTKIKVVKNRLFIKAMQKVQHLKNIETELISNQLLYAFNPEDEVAPAQVLAKFAKKNPELEFVGAIDAEGQVLSVNDLKSLASLPSKDQLRAQLAGTIGAPLSGFVNVLSGNVRGVLNILNARAESIAQET